MKEGNILEHWPRVCPVGQPGVGEALAAAVKAQGWKPIQPTHVFLRGDGEVLGYCGLSPVMISRLTIAKGVPAVTSGKLVQMVDTIQRAAGMQMSLVMVGADSPFVKVLERFGYGAVGAFVLAGKEL